MDLLHCEAWCTGKTNGVKVRRDQKKKERAFKVIGACCQNSAALITNHDSVLRLLQLTSTLLYQIANTPTYRLH